VSAARLVRSMVRRIGLRHSPHSALHRLGGIPRSGSTRWPRYCSATLSKISTAAGAHRGALRMTAWRSLRPATAVPTAISQKRRSNDPWENDRTAEPSRSARLWASPRPGSARDSALGRSPDRSYSAPARYMFSGRDVGATAALTRHRNAVGSRDGRAMDASRSALCRSVKSRKPLPDTGSRQPRSGPIRLVKICFSPVRLTQV
jgi:hypothetical protein